MNSPDVMAAIALNRLGLGARPGEFDRVRPNPRGWALAQIQNDAPQPSGSFPDTDQRMTQYLAYQDADASGTSSPGRNATDAREARQQARRQLSQDTAEEFLARARLGVTTDHGFAERWALFWANAFTVSAGKFAASVFVGQYEREAIRPHVFGKFEDLALAAEQHPAMLLYLDQTRSVGPGSRAGLRRRTAGLNENLAREMLELHTVGAAAGYAQADVTELARALTGWSVLSARDARLRTPAATEHGADAFVFRAEVHEPGPRVVMGKVYPANGVEQGRAILRDLAAHPSTARRLSRRIATHFVADEPPPALVARLEHVWTSSGGNLAEVARALLSADETWAPEHSKVKTPYEFIVSAHRALHTLPDRIGSLRSALAGMGQPMFAAPSPEGWPDAAADWAGPNALVQRLNWARDTGEVSEIDDPVAIARQVLDARLSDRTRLAVARAESRAEAVTLFLMSPEFQRR